MPPPDYLKPSYNGAMDQANYFNHAALDAMGPIYEPANAPTEGIQTGLGPRELGTTLNPMQNQLQALQAKIREGASKIEFEFMGKQKGSSQASTPESYGKQEREIMRQIAALNNVKSSTHATPSVSGLAGFGQRGFSRAAQQEVLHEVQRAIDFAKDASTGGAIVVHTGEWQRPVSVHYAKEDDKNQFYSYEQEDLDAPVYVVDSETGEIIEGISKNRKIDVPAWHTAESWQKESGMDIVGKPRVDVYGNKLDGTIKEGDYVDQYGNYIKKDDYNQLFRRVPKYDGEEVKFKTQTLEWEDLEQMKKDWNKEHPNDQKSTEEIYAQLQLDNQILQAKGQSLFYLRQYEDEMEAWRKYKDALDFYEELDESLPEEEKWRLVEQVGGDKLGIIPAENKRIPDIIKEKMRGMELSMRHIHEASSAADARAETLSRKRDNIKTMEEEGLDRSGWALAKLAEEAMDKSKTARQMRSGKELEQWEDLYIAPENWHPSQYGSHPEELLNIVKKGREKFKERLQQRGMSDEKKMDELARKHIKTTFDIGHLNMWRSMMKRKQGESEEDFQNRFNGWVKEHMEKLHEEDAIGHLHLTDNFGYNDEHLSLGQGNAPVTEFVKWMQDHGYTDFIIEPGSFNPLTIMPDAWSYLGAVNWKTRQGMGFRHTHQAHAGWYAPPTYIVGAYVPSNEWTLWSGVQLE